METYLFLTSWTDQGLQDVKGTIERTSQAVETMERFGVRIFETYWTVGPYDIVFVAECPDQATAHAVELQLGARGNIRSTAMRAFDRGEMSDILEKLA
jgi:uncharacterized protein with GYD domain